jgi:hypothetical protein
MDNPWTRLTVCLYRKRKCIEELTIASHDSDDQEDKVTTIKEKKKQTTQEYEKVYSVLNVVYIYQYLDLSRIPKPRFISYIKT